MSRQEPHHPMTDTHDASTSSPSSVVSLDMFREAATRKHGDLPISVGDTTVTLRRPMRLTRDERAGLAAGEKRAEAARAEHPEIVKARRMLKAAEDRRATLDQDAPRKVVGEHDRRVSEAEDAVAAAVEAHGRSEVEQLDEMVEGVRDMLRAVADSRPGAEALLDAVGDDFYVLQEILTKWRGQAEPGEAQPSPS